MTAPSRFSIAALRGAAAGRGRMIRSGLWSLALRVAGLASGFALGVVLARILGPEEFGIYGLVTTLAAVGMTVAQLGTPQLAVRELSVRASRGDWAGAKSIILSFGRATSLAGLAIGLIAIAVAALLKRPGPDFMLVAQGAALALLTAYTGLFAAELRGLGALIKGQAMDITVRPAVTFIIVALLLLAGSRMNAPLALSIQNAVTLGAVAVSALWVWQALPRSPARPERPRGWLKAALPLGAVDVLRQFDGSYGVILVGWLSTGVELGTFRVAVACAVLAAMPVTIFHILLAPTLSRLHAAGDRVALQRLLRSTAVGMSMIMLPITVGAWFVGRTAVSLVFGEAYAPAWLPLFLLTVAQQAYAFFGMGPILLAMCDGERDLIRIYGVAVGSAVAAAIPLTYMFGGEGAAIGPILSALIIGFLSRRFARRELGVEIAAVPRLKS